MPGIEEKKPLYTYCCPSIRPHKSLCCIDYPTQHDMDVISAALKLHYYTCARISRSRMSP